jgi:hypothetical protein
MAKAAQTEYCDRIAGPCAAVPKRIVGCDARTHQRCGVNGGKPFRDERKGSGGSNHILGIASVERNAGDLRRGLAGNEVSTAARIAMPAVSAVPAHTDPLARSPFGNACANFINDPGNLMPGNPRVLYWPYSLLGYGVAVADAARLDFDAHGSIAGFRDFAFNEFKGALRLGHLNSSHRCHNGILLCPATCFGGLDCMAVYQESSECLTPDLAASISHILGNTVIIPAGTKQAAIADQIVRGPPVKKLTLASNF